MKIEHLFLRIIISIMLTFGVILIEDAISSYVFYSCPARASATTDDCINQEIDNLSDMIFMIWLILIPILFPITLISPIVAFKNANITKLRYWIAGLTALIITLLLIIKFLEAHSAALR